jgi:hypothetical protein
VNSAVPRSVEVGVYPVKMISTFQALLVTLLALLPGALYSFAYERVAGGYGISFSDRLLRFVAASAVLHALLAAPEVYFYRTVIVTGVGRARTSVSG